MNQEMSEFERNMILLSIQARIEDRDIFLFHQLKDSLSRRTQNELHKG